MNFFEDDEHVGGEHEKKVIWFPQVGPQTDAIQATWVGELLYGGARGGGKSDYLLCLRK